MFQTYCMYVLYHFIGSNLMRVYVQCSKFFHSFNHNLSIFKESIDDIPLNSTISV